MTSNNRKIELHIHIKGVESLGDIFNVDVTSLLPSEVVGDKEESPDEGEEESKVGVSKGNADDPDELFTVAEFASYFRVSQITARSWLKKNLIPYFKIGKRIRIRKSEILALEKRRAS